MKHLKLTATVLVAVLAAACTTVNYESPQFGERASGHQTIAVLPFEMILTGKLPPRLTADQIAFIEEQESLAFQTALYHSLLDRSSVRRKRPILIEIQPVQVTNTILRDNGIGIRESWFMEPEDLAGVLGVDAVVRTAVHKNRFLSDGESFGIDLGLAVFNEATDGRLGWMIPWGVTTTSAIWADSTLVNGSDGGVLWKIVVERATDWTRPANDVIVGITRKLARKFPYRA
jgi:hypothetical protein